MHTKLAKSEVFHKIPAVMKAFVVGIIILFSQNSLASQQVNICNTTFLDKDQRKVAEKIELALFSGDSRMLRKWTKLPFDIPNQSLKVLESLLSTLKEQLIKEQNEDLIHQFLINEVQRYIDREVKTKEASYLEEIFTISKKNLDKIVGPRRELSTDEKKSLIKKYVEDYSKLSDFHLYSGPLKSKFPLHLLRDKLDQFYMVSYGFSPRILMNEISVTSMIRAFPFTSHDKAQGFLHMKNLVENLMWDYQTQALLDQTRPRMYLVP